MSYIDGFLIAVPEANKAAYLKMAEQTAVLFREYGAVRVMETWGDDVRDGKVTDFKMAVKAEPGETVVFSWVEWPDKATRDRGHQTMMSDGRMEALGQAPFDGKRMVIGGFATLLDA